MGGRQQLLAELLQLENRAPVHPGFVELLDGYDRREKHRQGERLEWRASVPTADRWESDLKAADPLTGEIKKSVHLNYPNYSGHARDGRAARVSRARGRHGCGVRRHHTRPIVEDQCRLRLFRAADDVRGQRQAIYRDRLGTEPGSQREARQFAGGSGAASRTRAACVRVVSKPNVIANGANRD